MLLEMPRGWGQCRQNPSRFRHCRIGWDSVESVARWRFDVVEMTCARVAGFAAKDGTNTTVSGLYQTPGAVCLACS